MRRVVFVDDAPEILQHLRPGLGSYAIRGSDRGAPWVRCDQVAGAL
jgi:hypothetical protein